MAKVAVPIILLKYEARDAFPNEIHEIFEREGVWNRNEDFTFTGRVSINPDRPDAAALKEKLAKRLAEVLGREEAGRLLEILEAHEWDVSFFVDCW